MARLKPHLTLGPPEPADPDPFLGAALAQLGSELNLAWDAEDPDVILGKLSITVDHLTNPTVTTVIAANGAKQRIPAMQHRFLARAAAQVELGEHTRTLHVSEEACDATWDALPKIAGQSKFAPSVPAPEELKRRAVFAWVRALARALASEPPEVIEVVDDTSCVAYGLALNINAGNPLAAANGLGDADKIETCEKLLGEPPGAGIPVP